MVVALCGVSASSSSIIAPSVQDVAYIECACIISISLAVVNGKVQWKNGGCDEMSLNASMLC